MTDTPFFADENDRSVSELAEFIALLGVAPSGPSTFLAKPSGNLKESWKLWQENWFTPAVAPAFCRIHQLALNQSVAEIVREDLALSGKFTNTISERSLNAALPFLEGKSEMKANREWKRFHEAVESGQTKGHITTLFALQSALYHLPLAPSLIAYARWEFVCGTRELASGDSAERERIFQSILPHVSVAVQRDCNEDTEGGTSLRAL